MRKPSRILKIMIICLAAVFMLAGCTRMEVSEEIVLGVAWPLAADNTLFNEGIDLAVKEINDSGGINGRKLRLLKEDDGADVVKGMAVARSLAGNESVRAVIGHRNSFVSIPAAALYEQAGLVMLSPASTAPELTAKGYRHIFRNIPSDKEIARHLAAYLAEQEYRRLVIYYAADSYGRGLAKSFEEAANSQGITIVDRFNYYSGPEDLQHLKNRWQAFGCDGIFIANTVEEAARFVTAARQAGIDTPFFGGNALESNNSVAKMGGQAAEGTIIGSVFNPDNERPQVTEFVADFQQAYQHRPDAYAALGYDAVKMLAAALESTDGGGRLAVARELRNLGRWQGVCGSHELDEEGDDRGELVVLKQLQDEKWICLPE